MKFYKDLYISEESRKKRRKIKHKIRFRRPMQDMYLIVLSNQPDAQLEIYNSNHLLQPAFSEDQFIVAVTKGYSKALEYVEHMLNKVYNETGNADIRAYILNREQELL